MGFRGWGEGGKLGDNSVSTTAHCGWSYCSHYTTNHFDEMT